MRSILAVACLWAVVGTPVVAVRSASPHASEAKALPGGFLGRAINRADHVSPDQVALLARSIGATRFAVVRHDTLRLDAMDATTSTVVVLGSNAKDANHPSLLPCGGDVPYGLIINVGIDAARLHGEAGVEYTLNPGDIMVVGDFLQRPAATGSNGSTGMMCCFIDCPTGYYACCNCTGGNPPCTCACIKNGTPASCGSGGSGSPKCDAICP